MPTHDLDPRLLEEDSYITDKTKLLRVLGVRKVGSDKQRRVDTENVRNGLTEILTEAQLSNYKFVRKAETRPMVSAEITALGLPCTEIPVPDPLPTL